MEITTGLSRFYNYISTGLSPTAAGVSLPAWIEMLAILICAASGVFSAREKHLDYIGTIASGMMCGLGGGLLRDVIMQVGDVYMMRDPLAIPIVTIACLITFGLPGFIYKSRRLIIILDIFSVGLFSAIGADKAMMYGLGFSASVFLGTITAVGGGMLRDICMAEIPNIFKSSNYYAVASLAGSAVYYILAVNLHIQKFYALLACVFITLLLRYISVRFDILSQTDVDFVPMISTPLKKAARNVIDAANAPTAINPPSSSTPNKDAEKDH